MKILSAEKTIIDLPTGISVTPLLIKLSRVLNETVKVFIIPALTLAIITGIYLAIITPGLAIILQAGLFISGFVFLALAVDAEKTSNGWLLAATGLALPVLAKLGSTGSEAFTILALLLLALWVGAALARR